MTKAKQETVKLPVKVTTGARSFMPGEDVPLSKDFTAEDAERIETIHGKYVDADSPSLPSGAKTDAKLAAKDEEIAALRAVIAAYEAADVAAVKAGTEGATSEDQKALDDAIIAVTAARKAAKL